MPEDSARQRFFDLVNQAVDDLVEHGFDSTARLNNWLKKLEAAARDALVPAHVLERHLRDALHRTYLRVTSGLSLGRKHKGLDEYTLAAIKPRLRSEVDRRILAAADLIKLNREQSIHKTLQRFAGWATSIPIGGSAGDTTRAKRDMKKAVKAVTYEERRVVIDQNQKLVSSIDRIVAEDGGAIAAVWHSRWRERGYDYREDHKERDGVIFVVRDNWALRKGYMKRAGREFTDKITEPGEEIFCRCRYEYLYTLRDLPSDMITAEGRLALAAVRRQLGMTRPSTFGVGA